LTAAAVGTESAPAALLRQLLLQLRTPPRQLAQNTKQEPLIKKSCCLAAVNVAIQGRKLRSFFGLGINTQFYAASYNNDYWILLFGGKVLQPL